MRLTQLQRPLQAVATGAYLPALTFTLAFRPAQVVQPRLGAGNAAVEGRRYAAVKSQGAYKLRPRKTIAKKMGAKRTGEQYVIPGNIIYKQRGTIWHPGENTILGRDHTIHAAVSGYVKYYRDPARHPTRQYIGVAYERDDKLPYPAHAVRRRKLGMVAVPLKAGVQPELMTASGIPRRVVRKEGVIEALEAKRASTFDAGAESPEAAAESQSPSATTKKHKKPSRPHPLGMVQRRWQERRRTRVLHLNRKDYSYAEGNAALGRLVGKGIYTAPWKIGGRKGRFRKRARVRRAEQERLQREAEETRRMLAERKEAGMGGRSSGGGGGGGGAKGKKEKGKKKQKV